MLTSSLLLSSLVVVSLVVAAPTKVPLGYGVLLNPTPGKSPCVLSFEVPVGDSSDDCTIEVRTKTRVGRSYGVLFKAEVDGFAFNAATDAATKVSSDVFSVPCKSAGNYSLAVTVSDTIALPGQLDSLSVTRRVGRTYRLALLRKRRTAQLALADGEWAIFTVKLNATASPSFDLDFATTAQAAAAQIYVGAADADVTVAAESRKSLVLDAAGAVSVRDLTPGTYQLGVRANGAALSFRLAHDINNDAAADALEFPLQSCPREECGAAAVQSCRACTQGGCSWCDESRTCTAIESGCAVPYTSDAATCPNVQELCAAHDCVGCTDDNRCVWCQRPASDGGSFCSAGKDDLAAECPGDVNTVEVAVRSQCPEVVKDTFETADRLCAKKASCTACAQDPSCTYCDAKIGNDRCTAAKTCDAEIFATKINDTAKCPDVQQCSSYTKCTTCASDSTCGWCDVANKCQPAVNECRAAPGATAVQPLTNATLCPRMCVGDECNCAQYTGCTACTLQSHCIFCLDFTGKGTCVESKGSFVCPSLMQSARKQCNECAEYPNADCPRSDAAHTSVAVALALCSLIAALLF